MFDGAHHTVPPLQVVLGRLEDQRVGGVSALEVGATEVGDLHVLTTPSHLALKIPLTDAGFKVFTEPRAGWLVISPLPARSRSEVVELGDYPGHWLPDHVHQVHLLLQPRPVRLVEMSVKHHRLLAPCQLGEDLGLILLSQGLSGGKSQSRLVEVSTFYLTSNISLMMNG